MSFLYPVEPCTFRWETHLEANLSCEYSNASYAIARRKEALCPLCFAVLPSWLRYVDTFGLQSRPV